MKKLWYILTPDTHTVQELCRALNCHPIIAILLANRGICSPEDASRFLDISLDHLRPPFAIKDMDLAVHRIILAITRKEKILIFGDYDADGITATTILLEFFNQCGADVIYYIPHRITEGYSLQTNHIPGIVTSENAKLIITVDCGSSSNAAAAAAKQAGVDVIVVDHHNLSSNLPSAVAVINPKRPDCHAGFEDLSGVGVTFFLIIALRKQLRDMGFWQDLAEPNLRRFCDLVALGTVADMVPLLDENRILTHVGLEEIGLSHRSGIRALLKVSGIPSGPVHAEDIAYKLAPRLNSPGRMDHADISVQLLTAKDTQTADKIANHINSLNLKRQETESQLLSQVLNDLKQHPNLMKKRSLVLSCEGWNEGILGIVAARMVRRFNRPVILISMKDGEGKGSARSIPGFDLYQGLTACSSELAKFGGHPMAAGLTIRANQLERFIEKFEMTVQKMTRPEDFAPKTMVDLELSFEQISDELINEIQRLNPFGAGNPEPVFLSRDVQVVSSKIVGNTHRRMVLKTASSRKTFNAIQFNINPENPLETHYEQILFRLNWNYWNGQKIAQITIEDM